VEKGERTALAIQARHLSWKQEIGPWGLSSSALWASVDHSDYYGHLIQQRLQLALYAYRNIQHHVGSFDHGFQILFTTYCQMRRISLPNGPFHAFSQHEFLACIFLHAFLQFYAIMQRHVSVPYISRQYITTTAFLVLVML